LGSQLVSTFQKPYLDTLKNEISTVVKFSTNLEEVYAKKSRLVSIFIFVSIETLDLNISKSLFPHVKKVSTLWKRTSRHVETSQFRSWLASLLRPPSLIISYCFSALSNLLLQWKPLNVITLGQIKTDNINRMITISEGTTYLQ
jgi:hypothetical protein